MDIIRFAETLPTKPVENQLSVSYSGIKMSSLFIRPLLGSNSVAGPMTT